MILDDILRLAADLGIPAAERCDFNHTQACQTLDRIETLLMIDHEPGVYLGERFRFAKAKVSQ